MLQHMSQPLSMFQAKKRLKTVLAERLEAVNDEALSDIPEVSVKSQHHEVRLRLRHPHRQEEGEGCGHLFPGTPHRVSMPTLL